jgi:hypothetical protein
MARPLVPSFIAAVALLAAAAPSAAAADPVGSCRDGSWSSVTAAQGQVRVWWRTDSGTATRDRASARRWAREIDRKIWPRLTTLLGEPVPDTGKACNGADKLGVDDGALDLWIVTQPGRTTRGAMNAYGAACDQTPAWGELDPVKGTRWTVAHELFHALQLRYDWPAPCLVSNDGSFAVSEDQSWLNESSASWAAHLVYPRDDGEHRYVDTLRKPYRVLDRPYDSWVFFLYMSERIRGGERLIRTVYENPQGRPNALGELDAALPGGFRRHFPEFALYGWNQEPVDDGFRGHGSFARWDRFGILPWESPNRRVRATEVNLGKRNLTPAPNLAPLSRRYYHLKVPNGRVRYVEVKNSLAGMAGASVQALVNIRGSWRDAENWTHRPVAKFCRDRRSQDVREIVLVVSNWQHAGNGLNPKALSVEGKRRCPKDDEKTKTYTTLLYSATYSGSASRHFEESCPGRPGGGYVLRDDEQITWDLSASRDRLEIIMDGGTTGSATPRGDQTSTQTTFSSPPPDTFTDTQTYPNAGNEVAYIDDQGREKDEVRVMHGRVYGFFGDPDVHYFKVDVHHERPSYTFHVSGSRSFPPEDDCTGGGSAQYDGTWHLKLVGRRHF